MQEFQAIAEIALKGLDVPEELRSQLIHRIAYALYWDRKLSYSTYQELLGNLRIDLEGAIAPKASGAEYDIGLEVRKIRRKYRGETE